MSSPLNNEIQNNIYHKKTNNFESAMPPMEFEVDISGKFESQGKGKSESSNRTNKFNYGVKKNSAKNFLGESDFTIGKQISPREFGIKINGKQNDNKNINIKSEINESSEEGEDLIIGNSVTLEPNDNLLEADEILPKKDLQIDDLEALESLSKEENEIKENKQQNIDKMMNYLTLKESVDLSSKMTRNLSQKDIKNKEKNKIKSLKKWKPRKNQKNKKINKIIYKSGSKRQKTNRSNSKIKLYKVISERESVLNNNSIEEKRKNSKTKWSDKKSERKQKLNQLFEKYSKEDNKIPEQIKVSKIINQTIPVAFSSTFGNNLHHHIKKAKPKPKPKINHEEILKKCKEFKHETQSNLFEVETLNTLTRAEDNYVAKPDYLNLNQPFLDAKVRTVLMGWMGEVSEDLWFCRDTFHMACNYVDRYLQLSPNIPKDKLQLIGLTCLYIASKMEEVQMRNVNDYLSSACNIYTEAEMMKCEIQIITVLDFKLNPPTLNLWANWYMNQWDNFLMSDTFVQEHPMIQESKIVAQFKQGNEESYNLYREFMQYLGI